MLSLTVVMPALNEEKNVVSAINNVANGFDYFGIDGELIVVNDGSCDRTGELAAKCLAQYRFPNKIVTHANPQGIGASFWDGAQQAQKHAVVMVPGDGENDALETMKFLPLIEFVDVIIPFVVNRQVRSFSRNLISRCFTFVINITFGLSLNYTNGTVIYKKQILDAIEHYETGFFYQVEILVKAIRRGALFAEVPCRLLERHEGTSTAVSWRSLKKVMQGYVRLCSDVYFSQASESHTSCR